MPVPLLPEPGAGSSALRIAAPRSSPLMRCAAQSAEMSSQDIPQTFSV